MSIMSAKNQNWTIEDCKSLPRQMGNIQMTRSESGINNTKPALYHWFRPVEKVFEIPETSLVSLRAMSFPSRPLRTHHLTASSSRIMHNVTKLMSSQAGFFNMRLLLFTHFHSHQISIQWRYFGMCFNQGFTLEMCSWHFCSSYCDSIMSTLTKICDKCFQPC